MKRPTCSTGFCITARQGRIADRSHEAQQYRASGLNLVIAAIVYWNSTYMIDAVEYLRPSGEEVPGELLAHTSPVGWEHTAFSGDFLWTVQPLPCLTGDVRSILRTADKRRKPGRVRALFG